MSNAFREVLSQEIRDKNKIYSSSRPPVIDLDAPRRADHYDSKANGDFSRRHQPPLKTEQQSRASRATGFGYSRDAMDFSGASYSRRHQLQMLDEPVTAFDLLRAERSARRHDSPSIDWRTSSQQPSRSASNQFGGSTMDPNSYASILRQPYRTMDVTSSPPRRRYSSGGHPADRNEDKSTRQSTHIGSTNHRLTTSIEMVRSYSPEIEVITPRPSPPPPAEKMPTLERENRDGSWMARNDARRSTSERRSDGRTEIKGEYFDTIDTRRKRLRFPPEDEIVVVREFEKDPSSRERMSSGSDRRQNVADPMTSRRVKEESPMRSRSYDREQRERYNVEYRNQRLMNVQSVDRIPPGSSSGQMKNPYSHDSGKDICGRCGLCIASRHDCIEALKLQLLECRRNEVRVRYDSSLLSKGSSIRLAFVKVIEREFADGEEQVDLQSGDTAEDVLRIVIARLNAREHAPEMERKHRHWLDYQLIVQGLSRLETNKPLNEPFYLPPEPHFLVLPKTIEIGLKVTKVYPEEDVVPISYEDDILMTIDPTLRVHKIKEYISSKLPIRWARHNMFYRDIKLQDDQVIFHAGIYVGDILEIIATPIQRR
ncbi:hypothetical protein HDE_03523 [Halotydeus destructor]|nr:hypothetical protein HDE_03523 [Halotydeus destructor]